MEELEHVYGIDARRIGSADRLDSEFKTEAQPSGSFECNPSKQNASCFGMHDMRRENCQLKATLQALSTEMKRRLDEAGGKTNSGKDEHDIVKNSPNKQNEQNEVAALTSIIIRLKEKNKV